MRQRWIFRNKDGEWVVSKRFFVKIFGCHGKATNSAHYRRIHWND